MEDPIPILDKQRRSPLSPIQAVCIVGLILFLLMLGLLCFFIFYSGRSFFGPPSDGNAFYQELEKVDALLAGGEYREKAGTLNHILDKLEKKALGVESHLSILKRRRLLAQGDPPFILPYQRAAQRVAEALPFSEPLAAIAAEALLWKDPTISSESAGELRNYASRLSETKLKPLALSLYILLGDLGDPLRAMEIPNKETLFSIAAQGEGKTDILRALSLDLGIDLAILRIFTGDIQGAALQINGMIQNQAPVSKNAEPLNRRILRFGAEFFYDYGNPIRAAELFAQFSDEDSIARQADALWLSGYVPGARNIWTALVSPEQSEEEGSGSSPAIKGRSLYNLAATAQDPQEALLYLTQFLAQFSNTNGGNTSQEPDQPYYIYGIIRYTRLLDTLQSIGILEKEKPQHSPLLDLELLRRQRDRWPVDKLVAEIWLLINRYPGDPQTYQWGCYLFNYQRRYNEIALLIKNAGYQQIRGPWMEFYESLRLVREGKLEEGEERLILISNSDTLWQIPANIARILEAQRAPSAALKYYETASQAVKDTEAAAKIQFRISACLRTLGRDRESRQALEQALQFKPDYLNARLELRRMDSRRTSNPEGF